MTSSSTALGSKFIWSIVAACSCVALFTVLVVCHPKQPHGTFHYRTAMAATWPPLWVFSMPGVVPPTFFDLQDILWACEVSSLGRDVYVEPPWSWDAPYVYGYPKGWLLLSHFGLNRTHTRSVGLVCAALFLIAAFVATRPVTMARTVWLVAGLFAPPSLECLAQANNDLVLFALLVLAAVFWELRTLGGIPAVGVIVAAGLLKLHPGAALVSLLDGKRRTLGLVAVGVLIVTAYFCLNWRDLGFMSRNTPRPHVHAVGHLVLPSRLFDGATRHPAVLHWFERAGGIALWKQALPLAVTTAFLGLLIGCARYGLRARSGQRPQHDDTFATTLFRLGACLHITSFAIGHNWLHREIFLLLTGSWLLAAPSRWWLAGLIVVAWWLGGMERGIVFVVIQVVTWIITGGLAYYLTASLSEPLQKSLPWFVRRFLPATAESADG